MRHDVEASRELETVLIHKCVSLYETHYYISVDQRVTELLDIEKSSSPVCITKCFLCSCFYLKNILTGLRTDTY